MLIDNAFDQDMLLRAFIIDRLQRTPATFRGTQGAYDALKEAGVTVDWERHTFLDEQPYGDDDSRVHMYMHNGLEIQLKLTHA